MKLLITTACIASLAVTQITFAQGTVAQLAQIARGDVTLAPDNASQTQRPSPSHPRPETPAEQTEARSFHEQLDQLTSHIINGDPELRSILGLSDDEYGDLSHLMSDVSLAKRDDLRNYFQQAQHQLSEYDRGALEGQERWSYDMAAWINRTQSDLLAFDWSPAWMPGGGSVYAVDQLFSIPVLLPPMIEKTGMNPRDVRAEINRYLVQPGQATSYKIGHLTILRLRQDAQAALGEHFDLRQFHDVVLGNGALPLLVLEQVIVDWLAEQQSVHATT